MTLILRSLRTIAIFSWVGYFAVTSLASAGTSKSPSQSSVYQGPFEQEVAGIERKAAKVYLPHQYADKSAWPLVVLLHGYTGTGETEDSYLTLRYRTSAKGFILVTPDGLVNSKGEHFWNATNFCCDFEKTGVNDVDYLQKLIKAVQARYHVDPKRIYLFGHSNGGFMANRLACEPGVRYAAIASFAGGTFKDAAECKNPEPTPFLQIHAINDTTVMYGDDPQYDKGTGSQYGSGQAAVKQWLARNGCEGKPTIAPRRNFIWALPGDDTTPQQWKECRTGNPVELWTIDAGTARGYQPHIPLFHLNFTNDVLDFLLSHSLKGPE